MASLSRKNLSKGKITMSNSCGQNATKISKREFHLGNPHAFRNSRPYGNRPRRRYFLIVCEGEKTEPNYFEAISNQLPKDMVKRITIVGTGRNTVDAAIRQVTQEKDFIYKKNDFGMFARLRDFTPQALARAERALHKQLEQHGTDWASMNPATRVHELVKVLMSYI